MKRSEFLKQLAFLPMMGMVVSDILASSPCKLVFTGTPEEKFKKYLDHFTNNGKKEHTLRMYIAEYGFDKHSRFLVGPVKFRMENGVYVTDMFDDIASFPIFTDTELSDTMVPYFAKMSWENGEECLGYLYAEDSFMKKYPGLEEWIHLPHEKKLLDNRFKLKEDE